MKYVWAMNPFDRNKKLDKKALTLIQSIPGASKALEAVFVASPNCITLATAFDVPEQDRYSRYPKEIMQKLLKTLGIKAAKCTVLPEQDLSLTKSVKTFAHHLTRNKANLALIASQTKTGLSRLVLGSFAESLVHFSRVDLLIFNENSSISKQPPKSLIFAHDYSKSADNGLKAAIRYAKTWRCSLHVVHVPDPAYGFKFKGQDPEVEIYRRRVRQKLQRIEKQVAKAGVFGSVQLDSHWSPVADRILTRASEVKADIVMVLAKSGKLAGFLGGSVTRQILRASQAPVLVIK
jgi:nucleotide-binding universal stress UspA family protein